MLDFFLHLANVIYLISYLVTDIIWLRALSVVGGAFSLTWTLMQPEARFSWIAWTLVYNVINVAQIARLILERRPVRLSDEEQRLYALVFRTLTPREFKRLLSVGSWEQAPAGQRLVEPDAALDRMLVVTDGAVAVKVGDRTVATLGEGRFVGEMSFLTGGRTTAAVEAVGPVRFLAWPTAALQKFLDQNGDLRGALQLLIGRDLVAKLAPARVAS